MYNNIGWSSEKNILIKEVQQSKILDKIEKRKLVHVEDP